MQILNNAYFLAVTVQEVRAYIVRLLGEVKIRALVVGNMYKDVSGPRYYKKSGAALTSSTGGYQTDRVCRECPPIRCYSCGCGPENTCATIW